MTNDNTLERDYDEINAILDDLDSLIRASEFHGVISGQLCAGLQQTVEQWWLGMKIHFDIKSDPTPTDAPILFGLYELTQRELADDHFSFMPVLPDDDYSLSERVQALSSWCQGFLQGFGHGGTLKDSDIEDDIKATLHDFAEVARVEAEIEPSEEEEVNYSELLEYVRVACLMVYGEYGLAVEPNDGSDTSSSPLH
ncbi:MAG: UPF0149 family protein [Pseudomonadales bacterium]|nr:UPF0149 family protein [Pseudomonadales bacterium]